MYAPISYTLLFFRLYTGKEITSYKVGFDLTKIRHMIMENSLMYIIFLYRIMESRQSCELNPNKIESATEACANAEFLLQVLDDITESIFMSSEACPRTLR